MGELFLDFLSLDKGGFFLAGSRGIWTWAPELIRSICIETIKLCDSFASIKYMQFLYQYLAIKNRVENLLNLRAQGWKTTFLQRNFKREKIKGFLTRGPARLYLLVNQPYRCTDRTRLPALFRARFKERGLKRGNAKRGFWKWRRCTQGVAHCPGG